MSPVRYIVFVIATLCFGCAVGQKTAEPGVIIPAAWLQEHMDDPSLILLHVGSRDVFDSVHIPGALFSPYQSLLSESRPCMFLGDDELRKAFEVMGMDGRNTAVYYCNTGVRASVSYMVAKHLGYSSLLYDGSFQDWENLDLPVTQPDHFKEKLSQTGTSITAGCPT